MTPIELANLGYYIFPVQSSGEKIKSPYHGFLWTARSSDDPAQIARWAEEFIGCWWAIDCGKSGLLVLDDDRGTKPQAVESLAALEREHGALPSTFTVKTMRGGFHRYYAGSTKNTISDKLGPGLDAKSLGGYVVAPCCDAYTIINHAPVEDAPAWLVERLGRPSERPAEPTAPLDPKLIDQPHAINRAFDYLKNHADVHEGGRNNAVAAAARRLHDLGISLELCIELLTDHLPVFPPVPSNEMWTTVRSSYRSAVLPMGNALAEAAFDEFVDPDPTPETKGAPDGWGCADLTAVLDGTAPVVEPLVGRRDDGIALLYPGLIHSLASESEGGKTWLALQIVKSEIQNGKHAIYIDFEDSAAGIVGRLLAMGAGREAIAAFFGYIQPTGPVDKRPNHAALQAILDERKPGLVVLDGITEAMSMHGLELKDNTDIAKFGQMLPRWIANRGPAVLMLDHVVKSKDSRGRYAIGGVHKLNAVNGASFTLNNQTPFAIGQTGRSWLHITKDRPGKLRQHGSPSADNQTCLGSLAVSSTGSEPGNVTVHLYPPPPKDDNVRNPARMKRIMDTLTEHGALTQRALLKKTTGNQAQLLAALLALRNEGFVSSKSPYEILRPFDELENGSVFSPVDDENSW